MSRKRKKQSAARGSKGTGWLSAIAWHQLRRPLWYTFCAAAGVVLVLAGSRAIAHFDDRLNQSLLTRTPSASVEFVDLPEGLMALAGGDLRGSIADLLERPWTQPDLCRLIAERLGNIGWIEDVESVQRSSAGRFEIKARYRLPVALVGLRNDDYVLIDGQGVRLPGLYIYHPRWHIIDGVDSTPPKVGQRWGSPDLQAGLAVLAALRPEPFRAQITGVNVANFAGRKNARSTHLELFTDRAGGRIRWGSAPGFEVEENLAPQKLALLRQNFAQTGRADAGHPIIDISTFPDRFHIPG
jgi:hypothetical protein